MRSIDRSRPGAIRGNAVRQRPAAHLRNIAPLPHNVIALRSRNPPASVDLTAA